MPKAKKPLETQAEQSARFEAEVQRLVDAGELNRIAADTALKALTSAARVQAKP